MKFVLFFLNLFLFTVALAQDFVPGQGDKLIEMSSEYIGEDQKANMIIDFADGKSVVEYIADDPEELLKYKVEIKNGKLYQNGKLYSTDYTRYRPHTIWVMDERGDLFFTDKNQMNKFHHSSFVNGGPVYSAGEAYIEEGRIVLLNNYSGHYSPDPKRLNTALKRLEELGYHDTSKIIFGDFTILPIEKETILKYGSCNRHLAQIQ